jgi:hypothetical protein
VDGSFCKALERARYRSSRRSHQHFIERGEHWRDPDARSSGRKPTRHCGSSMNVLVSVANATSQGRTSDSTDLVYIIHSTCFIFHADHLCSGPDGLGGAGASKTTCLSRSPAYRSLHFHDWPNDYQCERAKAGCRPRGGVGYGSHGVYHLKLAKRQTSGSRCRAVGSSFIVPLMSKKCRCCLGVA